MLGHPVCTGLGQATRVKQGIGKEGLLVAVPGELSVVEEEGELQPLPSTEWDSDLRLVAGADMDCPHASTPWHLRETLWATC